MCGIVAVTGYKKALPLLINGLQKLKDEKIPIARVAWDCGFQDPNYYARWFRKKIGQSPRQWRAGHR